MNRRKLFAVAIGVTVSAGILSACGSTPSKTASGATAPSTATPSAIQTNSGLTLPVASNPIVNNSATPNLQITYAAAENNVDPATKNPIGDQLELTLKNSSSTPMSGIEVYYEMTDIVTKAKEAYYQKLNGLIIPAKQESTVYFDNKKQAGHYPENQFSLYRSSQNEVDFKIWVSAPGSKIAQTTAIKSKGTSEKPNA